MGKRKKIAERVTTLMDKPEFIRNIGIVAHIDHGKTTLSDNLLGGAGMISMDLAGKQLFMDFDPLEQARGSPSMRPTYPWSTRWTAKNI